MIPVKALKRIICFCLTAFAALLIMPISVEAKEKLKIGYYEDGDYMSRDKDGSYVGFNFEYLQKITQYAGWEYEVIDGGSWDHTFKMLETGEIDILPSVYYTEDREEQYLFSKLPMCNIYSTLNVRVDDNRYDYEDYESFNGMTVGVIENSVDAACFVEYCRDNNVSVTVIPYQETQELLDALDDGTLDGVAITYLGKNSIFRCVAQFSPQPLYFAVTKSRPDLAQELDAAMSTIKLRDPYYESRLYQKYFSINSLQDPVFTREEEEYIEQVGAIRAVYVDSDAPLEYTDKRSGQFSGVEADLFRIISQKSGLKFEFLSVENCGESYQMLSEGEADLLCSVDNDYLWSEKNHIDTTTYYLKAPLVAVSTGNKTKGKRIALTEGRYIAERIAKDNPEAEILYYPSNQDCFNAVKQGEADVTYTNTYIASYLMSDPTYSSFNTVTLINYSEDLGIGISEEADPRLFSILDKCIQYIPSEQMDTWLMNNSAAAKSITFKRIIQEYPAESVGITALIFLILTGIMAYIAIIKSRNNKRFQVLLYQDRVTGIWNINKFREEAERILNEDKEHSYAVLYMDVNQFKTINDSFGFKEGDELLRLLAGILSRSIAPGECCARMSADHFVMLLQYESWEKLTCRTSRIAQDMNNAIKAKQKSYSIHLIFGVYIVETTDKQDISLFLDFANYARRSGKNFRGSITLRYDEAMRQEELWRRRLSDIMEPALQNGEFVPYFQPKVNIFSGDIVGAEALVRWLRPGESMLSPGSFIPFFESNGFIIEMDLYIYEQVCRSIRKWMDEDKPVHPVSSNFSRLHFKNKHFPDTLSHIADAYGVPHKYLEVEITENILMDQIEEVQNHLYRLKELGFLISIDDFGSGYSSLGILQQLSVDTIKLDGSLIGQSLQEKRRQIIVEGIITLAKGLGIQVICEGVETEEQTETLKVLGCTTAQGFYYARPLPLEEFEKML